MTPRWRAWTVLAALALAGLVAGALVGGVATVASVLVAVQVARVAPAARRHRAQQAHEAHRRELRDRREGRLDAVCAPTLDLPELAVLVDRCIPCGASDPFELDALLDRYADAALARHGCRRALAIANRSDLAARLEVARVCTPMAVPFIERRMAHAGEARRLAYELDDSLSALAELVRYYAARAAQPEVEMPLEEGLVAEVLERLEA